MIAKSEKSKKYTAAVLALIYWAITFVTEKKIFDVSRIPERMFTYVSIKILTLLTLFALFYLLLSFVEGIKTKNAAFYSVLYAIPYAAVLIFRRMWCGAYPFIGDEQNIFWEACSFSNLEGMFHYITTYFHMVAMQLWPDGMSMIVFKHIVCGLAVGYSIYRINRLYKNKWGFLVYLIFFVPYVIDISWSVHRMPMYGPLYLFFASVLYCDYKENAELNMKKLLLLALVCAVLTQWRVEGICLLFFGPVFILLAYHVKADKKQILKILAVCLAMQVFVWFPQKLETRALGEGYAVSRTMYFYNYVLPNMVRKGLDREKNAEDLAVIEKYVKMEDIDALNEDLGESVYYDEFIHVHTSSSYNSLVISVEQAAEYEGAIRHIILRNPLLYVRTQLGAFLFISTSYGLNTLRGVMYTITGNLIVPALIMIAAWVVMLIRKRWFEFLMLTSPLCHAAITTALLPAAYFKYYYMQFILAYAIVVLVIAGLWNRRKRVAA